MSKSKEVIMAPNTVEPQGKGVENYGSHSLSQMQNWPLLSGKKYRASEQDQEWVRAPRMGKGGENLKEDRVTSRDTVASSADQVLRRLAQLLAHSSRQRRIPGLPPR